MGCCFFSHSFYSKKIAGHRCRAPNQVASLFEASRKCGSPHVRQTAPIDTGMDHGDEVQLKEETSSTCQRKPNQKKVNPTSFDDVASNNSTLDVDSDDVDEHVSIVFPLVSGQKWNLVSSRRSNWNHEAFQCQACEKVW